MTASLHPGGPGPSAAEVNANFQSLREPTLLLQRPAAPRAVSSCAHSLSGAPPTRWAAGGLLTATLVTASSERLACDVRGRAERFRCVISTGPTAAPSAPVSLEDSLAFTRPRLPCLSELRSRDGGCPPPSKSALGAALPAAPVPSRLPAVSDWGHFEALGQRPGCGPLRASGGHQGLPTRRLKGPHELGSRVRAQLPEASVWPGQGLEHPWVPE